jgi:hypothetical protein
MNKKQMSMWYSECGHETFKVLVNGTQYYIDKHDKRMKKLFDTGKIKEFMPTSEIFRLKKEAEKMKKQRKPLRHITEG